MQYYSRHCASEGFKFSIDLTTSVTQEHWRCSINGRRDFLFLAVNVCVYLRYNAVVSQTVRQTYAPTEFLYQHSVALSIVSLGRNDSRIVSRWKKSRVVNNAWLGVVTALHGQIVVVYRDCGDSRWEYMSSRASCTDTVSSATVVGTELISCWRRRRAVKCRDLLFGC